VGDRSWANYSAGGRLTGQGGRIEEGGEKNVEPGGPSVRLRAAVVLHNDEWRLRKFEARTSYE